MEGVMDDSPEISGFGSSEIELQNVGENAQADVKSMSDQIRNMAGDFKFEGAKFIRSDEGNISLVDSNGKTINMDEITKNWRSGNFENVLENLGVDVNSEEAQSFIEDQRTAFAEEKYPITQQGIDDLKNSSAPDSVQEPVNNAIDQSISSGSDQPLKDAVQKAGGDPGKVETLKTQVENVREDIMNKASAKDSSVLDNEAKIKQLRDQIKEARANGEDTTDLQKQLDDEKAKLRTKVRELLSDDEIKKSVKDNMDSKGIDKWKALQMVVVLGLLAVGGFLLAEYLKELADAANGCWANKSGNSCKVAELTCKSADLTGGTLASKGINLCQKACTDLKCSDGDWMPFRKGSFCSCDLSKNPLDGYDPSGDPSDHVCKNNPNCPVQGAGKTTPSGSVWACPNANGCITNANACQNPTADDNCSTWCSNDIILPLKNIGYSCINKSPADCLGDLVDDLFSDLGDIWNKVEKILIIVAIVIIVVIAIFFFVKLYDMFFEGDYDAHDHDYEPVYISQPPVSLPPVSVSSVNTPPVSSIAKK